MTGTTLLILGASFLGSTVFVIVIVLCVWSCQMSRQLSDFNEANTAEQIIVWRLDGEEWKRYLDYIHGPDRQWKDLAPLSCFCCRRASYDRLLDRQYGHIILYKNGFIIDELHLVSFRLYSLQGIEYLSTDQNPPSFGLRMHTFLHAGKNSRNVYFDLFAPSSVTQEQVLAIARSYNTGLSGFDRLNTILP